LERKTELILVDIQNDYFPEYRMELVEWDQAGLKAKELSLEEILAETSS
jgi:hypothetical protein